MPVLGAWIAKIVQDFALISTSFSFSHLSATPTAPREKVEYERKTILRKIKEIHRNNEKLVAVLGSFKRFLVDYFSICVLICSWIVLKNLEVTFRTEQSLIYSYFLFSFCFCCKLGSVRQAEKKSDAPSKHATGPNQAFSRETWVLLLYNRLHFFSISKEYSNFYLSRSISIKRLYSSLQFA